MYVSPHILHLAISFLKTCTFAWVGSLPTHPKRSSYQTKITYLLSFAFSISSFGTVLIVDRLGTVFASFFNFFLCEEKWVVNTLVTHTNTVSSKEKGVLPTPKSQSPLRVQWLFAMTRTNHWITLPFHRECAMLRQVFLLAWQKDFVPVRFLYLQHVVWHWTPSSFHHVGDATRTMKEQ